MPVAKHKGEVTVRVGGVDLELRFKTRNLMVLSELRGGESPFEFLAKFGPGAGGDENAAALKLANPAFILPVLVAGCAHHPEYRRDTVDILRGKLEDLIDKEVETSGLTPIETYMILGSQVVFPLICAIQGVSELDGKSLGKYQEDLLAAVAEMKDGKNSVGDA